MSLSTLVLANLHRNPLRTLLTVACLMVAFLLFGLLQPLRLLLTQSAPASATARLVVGPKHSLADMLPLAYGERIGAVVDVDGWTHLTWFGGTYVDPANFFPQFAVAKETFLAITSEVRLPADQARDFLAERRAAIAGRDLAERFGWTVGTVISLVPNIWHNRDGVAWEFRLAGIFESSDESLIGNDGFYFGYDYFDEYRAFGNGTVSTFLVRVADPARLDSVAAAIDDGFANSSSETRTVSDAQYALGFLRQMGEVGLMATLILTAVLFTMLLLTGHTMAQSVRERTGELAVLRVLGFRGGVLFGALLGESVALTLAGAAAGLMGAELLLANIDRLVPALAMLADARLSMTVAFQAAVLALVIGTVVVLGPGVIALRRRITDALRLQEQG